MNDIIRLRTTAEIEEEAAAWVWRLDGEVSAADRKAFEEWVARDVRCRRAFEELGGVWNALDGLAEAKRAEKIATFSQLPGASHPPAKKMSSIRVLPYAIAATIVLSFAALFWLQRGNEAQTLGTAVGQQRTVSLADGSTLYLNTNTIVETRLDRKQRNIRLIKGEALFKVARDKQRPFFVRAGATVMRAVGTEFNVRMRDAGDIQVIVAEGIVAVSSAPSTPLLPSIAPAPAFDDGDGTGEAVLFLTAGKQLSTAKSIPVAELDAEMIAKTLAWRDGAIVFDGESLGQAIAELNRYTDTHFIVNDPRIREMKVGGRFKAGDVDSFLLGLKEALPVEARRTADNLVYIEPRAP